MKNLHYIRLIRKLYRISKQESRDKYAAYSAENLEDKISAGAMKVSEKIRGIDRPPAIIIHGVMPRSGTVYTGELLRLHPDVYAYPNELWEIPFLELTDGFKNIQQRFFDRYKPNSKKMAELDLLPLFGASLIAYLYSFVPSGKTLLIKVPDVKFLSYFPVMFPHENMLLLMRDGRDLVSSTVRTWPDKDFSKVCKEWHLSAKQMIDFSKLYNIVEDKFPLVKYEEVVERPDEFVTNACAWFDLNVDKFPFTEIKSLAYRGSSTLQSKGDVSWDPIKSDKDTKTVGHWEKWPAKQIKQFKKIAGKTLVESGYCSDLNW